MATITGFTADRMLEIEDGTVVDGEIIGDHLILTKHDGTQIDTGVVVGPQGPMGPQGPAGSSDPNVISSSIGLANLHADIDDLKGNSGAVRLNNSVVIPNETGYYGKSGTYDRLLAKVDASNYAFFAVDEYLAGVKIGKGQTISPMFSNGNAMFEMIPNYGGTGLPGFLMYNSGAAEHMRLYTDGNDISLRAAIRHLQLLSPSGGVYVNGMRSHRHPDTTERHIDSGTFYADQSVSVTFIDAYGTTTGLRVICGQYGNPSSKYNSNYNDGTTGFTAWANVGGGSSGSYIADGTD